MQVLRSVIESGLKSCLKRIHRYFEHTVPNVKACRSMPMSSPYVWLDEELDANETGMYHDKYIVAKRIFMKINYCMLLMFTNYHSFQKKSIIFYLKKQCLEYCKGFGYTNQLKLYLNE